MSVHLVGEGPAIDAVEAALSDVDVDVTHGKVDELASATVGVVSGVTGADVFDRAREVADRWFAVEVGGIGGVPLDSVDAAVTGFGSGTGCYRCLGARSRANAIEVVDRAGGSRSAVRLAGAIAGDELIGVLGGDESILGSTIELPYARHTFLPIPTCDCGTAPGPSIDRADDDDLSLETAVDRAEHAIDDRLGIVSSIGEAESFPAPYYLATLADTSGFSDGDAPEQAAGVDAEWNAALMKGVGEALERYAAAIYRTDGLQEAAPEDLDRAVAPAAFAAAEDDAPTTNSTETLRWVPGESLHDGDRVWLPADAVHFPPPEPKHVPAITTGLGLGSSPVGALLSGLTETIERDATMIGWYSTADPLGLAVDDDAFERLARRARSEGLSVTPLLVTQDVDVPVVTVAVAREEWPRFAVGSAADLDPIAAARSALAEALQNWMELRSVGRDDAGDLQGSIGHYADRPPAAEAFLDVETRVPVESVGPAEPPTGGEALDALVDALDGVGLDAYAARLTTRDLDALGFEAVRVLVPGAQPLFTGEPYFGERARTVPEELGFEARLDREPHPYP